MPNMGLTPHASIPNSYVHADSNCVIHTVGAVSELIDANGAFACALGPTGDQVEWAWAAGDDLLDILRLASAPVDIAKAILNCVQRGGPMSVVSIGEPLGSQPNYVGFHAFGQPNRNPNNISLFSDTVGVSYALFGLTNRLASGNGSSSLGASPSIESYFAGTTDSRSVFGTGMGVQPSYLVGTGRIRVPGGKSWLERIDQFYDGVLSGTPSDLREKVSSRLPSAKRRSVQLLTLIGPNLRSTLDVYIPVAIYKSGVVKIVPPSDRILSNQHLMESATRPLTLFRPWGTLTRSFWDRRRVTFPIRYAIAGGGAGCAMVNAYTNPTTVVPNASVDALLTSYPAISSIDTLPIGYFTGGLQGNVSGLLHGATKLPDSAPYSSTSLWNMYRNAFTITDGAGSPARATDVSTGLPASDATYAAQLQAEVASKNNASLRRIGNVQWDYGIVGMGMLLAVCDGATVPKKAKGWEVTVKKPDPLDWALHFGTTGTTNIVTVGEGPMFADTSDCFTDIS